METSREEISRQKKEKFLHFIEVHTEKLSHDMDFALDFCGLKGKRERRLLEARAHLRKVKAAINDVNESE